MAISKKRHAASLGDKVVAIVDGEYTLKTLAKDKQGNRYVAYEPICPRKGWKSFRRMVGLIRTAEMEFQ